ncbi:MAG: hypothetical protein MHM6MM_007650, partial [Cercozoa sp. M6MM]
MQTHRVARTLLRQTTLRSLRCMSEFRHAGIHPEAKYVSELEVQPEMRPAIDIFRMLQPDGSLMPGADVDAVIAKHPDEELVRMQKAMIQVSVLDRVLYDSQRQGRISFYMTR